MVLLAVRKHRERRWRGNSASVWGERGGPGPGEMLGGNRVQGLMNGAGQGCVWAAGRQVGEGTRVRGTRPSCHGDTPP